MKRIVSGSAVVLMTASPIMAGGIERAPQSLAILFEQGNYAELSFGGADPTIEGTDSLGFDTGDVAQGFGFVGLAYKHQFDDNLSAAIILEQPFGADISYPSAAEGGSVLIGETRAKVDSTTITALARYRFDSNVSVHGGIRGSKASGLVTLGGLAYGPVNGYEVDLDDQWGAGFVIGAAYEIPEIAARVSLTYNSSIEHDFDTKESGPGIDPDGPGPIPTLPLLDGNSTTTVKTPQSLVLEGQTGIAAGTLIFGSIRWVKWSEFRVDPDNFVTVTGEGLVELEDATTYQIGIGRQFTDAWSGSAIFTYEPEEDDLVSPLAPTNGRKGITLAAVYSMENVKITTGISYFSLGDAKPETGTPDTERASMEDSEAWGIGVRIGYTF